MLVRSYSVAHTTRIGSVVSLLFGSAHGGWCKLIRVEAIDGKNLNVRCLCPDQIGGRAAVLEFVPRDTLNRTATEHLVKRGRRQRADVSGESLIEFQRADGPLPYPLIPIGEIHV